MGVITKLLYRGNDLKEGKYRHLFLDMEENIHIHYRDLRIELSRDEFEDIAKTFRTQASELLTIIHDTDYQDGKLANSNQEDTRIWTESKLEHDVAYHPRRISIEECTDGYHLHLRNYKILLDKDDFQSLQNAFQEIDTEKSYAAKFDEIVELLYANDLHFMLVGNKQSTEIDKGKKEILVADYHEPKLLTIFDKIGLKRLKKNHYQTEHGLSIFVQPQSYQEILAMNPEGFTQPQIYLIDFLANNKINNDLLNQILCQVLNKFNEVKQNTLPINLDFQSWRYKSFDKEVVFPKAEIAQINTVHAYRNWTDFLKQQDLYFKKPSKIVFEKKHQEELYNQITDRLIENLIPIRAVTKIYIMGSAARMELGYYKQPFVHGNQAKLGSDIDLLIEIDEQYKNSLPRQWRYINQSTTNLCDIYHIDEIELKDPSTFHIKYPYINLIDHLFDAYVYFPSNGNELEKEAFLAKFKAKLIYSRSPTKTENKLHQLIKDSYGEEAKNIARLNVATENELYRFQLDNELWVLKLHKVAGNYSSSRLEEHVQYEADILNKLQDRNIVLPRTLKSSTNEDYIMIEANVAMVYSYLQGKLYTYPDPDYPIFAAASALASFHNAQIERDLNIATGFSFDHIFNMWYPQFFRYAKEIKGDKELSEIYKKLEISYKNLKAIYMGLKNNKALIWLHNHGDLNPRNFIFSEQQSGLFDFQNAFYGPRLFDLVDASIEFCFGGKYVERDDFSRFVQFKSSYIETSKLNEEEELVFDDVVNTLGIIKFIKEVRMIKGAQQEDNLRRLRAMALGQFLLEWTD